MIRFEQERLPAQQSLAARVRAFGVPDGRDTDPHPSLSDCVFGYNIALEKGALVRPMGVSRATLLDEEGGKIPLEGLNDFGEKIRAFYHFRASLGGELMILVGSSGRFFQMDLANGDTALIPSLPAAKGEVSFLQYYFNGKETLLIYLSEGGMYTYDGVSAATHYPDVPAMTSVVMHYHRVYGVDGENTLYFSAPLDPTDFTEASDKGGRISLMDEGGKLLNLVEFSSYLFLFREHSVWRMIAYTDQSDFQVTKVQSFDVAIAQNSVAVGAKGVWFYADGFYRFDGVTLTPMFEGASKFVEYAGGGAGEVYRGAYYFACRIYAAGEPVGDEWNGVENNALFRLDERGEDFALLRGADVKGIKAFTWGRQSKIFLSFSNFRAAFLGEIDETGRLFGSALKKEWRSALVDLDRPKECKVWRDAYLESGRPVWFRVSNEQGRSVEVRFGGGRRAGRVRVGLVGYRFSYTLETEEETLELGGLSANFTVYSPFLKTASEPDPNQ